MKRGLPITIHTSFNQRDPLWYAERAPNLGGSEASLVVSGRNGKTTAGKRDLLIAKALAQCGIAQPISTYLSPDMARGIELESAARIALEFKTGHDIQEVGYLSCGTHSIGCSPDGIFPQGVIEIKCPRPKTHWQTFQMRGEGLSGIPTPHHPQIIHTLGICRELGLGVLIFCSYCPAMGEALELCLREVHAADIEDEINAYMDTLGEFLDEIDAEAERIRRAIAASKEETQHG